MNHVETEDDTTRYKVVLNHEEQYSIWPEHRENPPGWSDAGKSGPKSECLAYIKEVWTDMRPLSLRKKMEEMERQKLNGKEEPPPEPIDKGGDNLVSRLSVGSHRTEVSLRPVRTAKALKDALDRGFVLVKFLDTRGGTELGVRLDPATSQTDAADFEAGTGNVHLEGDLTLNYARVRCIADIDVKSLSGTGQLKLI